MGRRTRGDDLEERRPRLRARPSQWDEAAGEDEREQNEPELLAPLDLPEALLALCARHGLEPWAAQQDERGIWGFATVLGQWLARRAATDETQPDLELQVIRLATNLFVLLGAVIKPLPASPLRAEEQALAAVSTARRRLTARRGLLPPFRGCGRAMRRLTRVRGWPRLSAAQQSLAEALLALYLETLAALLAEPDPEAVLAASEAWLSVIYLGALPRSFDEHLLRATAWYLENLPR